MTRRWVQTNRLTIEREGVRVTIEVAKGPNQKKGHRALVIAAWALSKFKDAAEATPEGEAIPGYYCNAPKSVEDAVLSALRDA